MDSSLLSKLGPFGKKYSKKVESYRAGANKGNHMSPLTKILNVAIAKKATSSGFSKGGTTRSNTGTTRSNTGAARSNTGTTRSNTGAARSNTGTTRSNNGTAAASTAPTGRITRSTVVVTKPNGITEVNAVRSRPPTKALELPQQKKSRQIMANEKPTSTQVLQKPNLPIPVNIKANQDKHKQVVAPAVVKKAIVVPPAIVEVKKLKPQGIDRVFMEHNSNFAKACETLAALENYWKDAVLAPDIPEEIRDDIIAALGKVQLLLGSKLPQFSQLLYSYICKELDPRPMLECDLQGWWDVASIQLEAIEKEFQSLLNLQSSNWIKHSVEPSQLKTKMRRTNENKTPRKPKPANASKGMRAFLAMKRKANVEDGTSNSNSDQTPKRSMGESVANKTFDGGFFVINSPAR